jgi:hypothetical protein
MAEFVVLLFFSAVAWWNQCETMSPSLKPFKTKQKNTKTLNSEFAVTSPWKKMWITVNSYVKPWAEAWNQKKTQKYNKTQNREFAVNSPWIRREKPW